MIKVHNSFTNTQVMTAVPLLLRFVNEDAFWKHFVDWIKDTDLSHHDILEDDHDILTHIRFMFSRNLNVEILPYKTRWPWSSVIGHAKGNRVYENVRKLEDLTLPERIGHLGHEIVHLFGYHHEFQGQKTSAAVAFGEAMRLYSERRVLEIQREPTSN